MIPLGTRFGFEIRWLAIFPVAVHELTHERSGSTRAIYQEFRPVRVGVGPLVEGAAVQPASQELHVASVAKVAARNEQPRRGRRIPKRWGIYSSFIQTPVL